MSEKEKKPVLSKKRDRWELWLTIAYITSMCLSATIIGLILYGGTV